MGLDNRFLPENKEWEKKRSRRRSRRRRRKTRRMRRLHYNAVLLAIVFSSAQGEQEEKREQM